MRFLFVIGLLCLAKVAGLDRSRDCKCSLGKRQFANAKIIGGKEAPHYPWNVLLLEIPSEENRTVLDRVRCGGILINERTVLTAAHCVTKELNETAFLASREPIDYQTGYGDKDLNKIRVAEVEAVYVHPEYYRDEFDRDAIRNDVALLMVEPIVFSKTVQPACLPTFHQDYNGWLTATGWGLSDQNEKPRYLKRALLKDYSRRPPHCTKQFADKTIICALNKKTHESICIGDSGGPLHHDDVQNGKTIVVGISSFYLPTRGQIHPLYNSKCGTPAAFVRLSRFIGWIKSFIEDDYCN